MVSSQSLRKNEAPAPDGMRSRDELVVQYLPFVKHIVHRIAIHLPPQVELTDLINSGVIGLMQAIERYDRAKGSHFMAYAAFRIKGAVLSELRAQDFMSRSHRKQVKDLDRAYLKLEQELDGEVGDEDLARELGLDLESLYRIKCLSSISFVSCDEIEGCQKGNHLKALAWMTDPSAEDALTLAGLKELRATLAEMIGRLPEKEKLVVSLYYQEELTMKEIGRVLEITESRVSQIHSRAIVRLRSSLRKTGLLDPD